MFNMDSSALDGFIASHTHQLCGMGLPPSLFEKVEMYFTIKIMQKIFEMYLVRITGRNQDLK